MSSQLNNIFCDLINKNIVEFGEYPDKTNPNKKLSYNYNFHKIMSNSTLLINILEYVNKILNKHDLDYDKIVSIYNNSHVYACDIAISKKKGILIPDVNFQENKIKFPDVFEVDEKFLIILESLKDPNMLNLLINKIEQYGGIIVGIIIIFDLSDGLYLEFAQKYNVINVFNMFNICDFAENQNMIETFYAEKFKFYVEVQLKYNTDKYIKN